MENTNHINDLLEEGKKHLGELQQQIEKLAETAAKVIVAAGDEAGKHAEGAINEARTVIEDKTKDAMASDEFKKLEAEGKKAIEDAQVKLQEISVRANELANEVGEKLKNIFGAK